MNTEYFTKDNLDKVLDNEVYNVIKANEKDNVYMSAISIYNNMIAIRYLSINELNRVLERLINNNCIEYNDNLGYRTYFAGNFPEKCIEHY
jgi:hypothetical protein